MPINGASAVWGLGYFLVQACLVTRCDRALTQCVAVSRGEPELLGLFAQCKRHTPDTLRCGMMCVVGRWVGMGLLLQGTRLPWMDKQPTNSGPFRTATSTQSFSPWARAKTIAGGADEYV